MKKNNWLWLIPAAAILLYSQWNKQDNHNSADNRNVTSSQTQTATRSSQNTVNADNALKQAFESKTSNLQVQGSGTVTKMLPDDNKGSRHQRFILKLTNGQTLLVAHNIDLAPKIKGLKKGDTVGFNGEYEWSEQGGVIHWTHHDPTKRHVDGWLEHNGQRYQ
ncbi:DUF3465 domain-containing protein [Neisseria sp.]|uniref:DUF3465 domain-containing protein n=1 Tax=Neisseria sp. TaxID=192066 RepID=UPI0028A16950|nr:DUF3465 domain-containing protein [Neisseria sp.]